MQTFCRTGNQTTSRLMRLAYNSPLKAIPQ